VTGLLADLPTRWAGQRVMLIGHLATYRALELAVHHIALEDQLAAEFTWREHGWEYVLN
jgi:2,3-bisphosphoglycerate-dependent phosphoglycerate mutase